MNVLKSHGELHEKIVLKLQECVIYIHVPFHKPCTIRINEKILFTCRYTLCI